MSRERSANIEPRRCRVVMLSPCTPRAADALILCEALANEGESVDVEHGFRLLARAVNRSRAFPTLCSMIFDPTAGEIYIVLRGDFMRIWKVSLADGTIETHLGFAEHRRWPLDANGVTSKELN